MINYINIFNENVFKLVPYYDIKIYKKTFVMIYLVVKADVKLGI
jgi:hypothetical protein